MKKNYMQPSAEEWCAEFSPLMLGSITVNENIAEVELDDTEEYNEGFCSRGHKDVWEDEAENDEP